MTENVTEEAQEALPDAESQVEEVVTRQPPKSWPKEMHEYWGKTDPKVQEYWETREQQMLDGLEQYRANAKLAEDLNKVVAPYQQVMQQAGVDLPKAVSYLMGAHMRLTSGTQEQRMYAYQELGRSLGLLQGEQAQVDPAVAAAWQAAQQANQKLEAWERQQEETRRTTAMNEVSEFAKDKPYFDECADHIARLIETGLSLQDAYDAAIYANPVTRQKEIARVQKEAADNLKAKAMREAKEAKRAMSPNVRSRDTGRVPTEPLGKMEDTMAATLKEIRGRTH